MPKQATPQTFHPAPGYILGRPVTREEISKSTNKLLMPDAVGKLKDSVGIAEVLELGDKLKDDSVTIELKPGDLIAYIPFTDAIIEEGSVKHNLVPYKNVMAIRPQS